MDHQGTWPTTSFCGARGDFPLAGAAYEWNYGRQMMGIRLAEGTPHVRESLAAELFSEWFLTQRALLQAIDPKRALPPLLLVDELGRADEPFEWTRALMELDALVLDPEVIQNTLGVLLKYQDDIALMQGSEAARLPEQTRQQLRSR